MPKSFLDVNGIYTPGKRFAFTNITDEEFTSYWNKIPVIVKPHETIEISDLTPLPGVSMGHNLAFKFTTELVDKIMIKGFKEEESQHKEPYYRSPQASSLGVPAARKVWEDQILREMDADEESPAIKLMKQQLRDEIINQAEAQPSKEPVLSGISDFVSEFSEIKKSEEPVKTVEVTPAKTKKL